MGIFILRTSLSYWCFKNIDGYQKPSNDLRDKDFFSKLKIGYPDDTEKERTKEVIKLFDIKVENS